MKRISSGSAIFAKKMFYIVIIWPLIFIFVVGALAILCDEDVSIMIIIYPAGLLVSSFLIKKMYIDKFVDEVYEDGDGLLIIKQKQKVRVPFRDIKNMRYMPMDPSIVIVSLDTASFFGTEFRFSLPVSFFPFDAMDEIEELSRRIKRHRGSRS